MKVGLFFSGELLHKVIVLITIAVFPEIVTVKKQNSDKYMFSLFKLVLYVPSVMPVN